MAFMKEADLRQSPAARALAAWSTWSLQIELVMRRNKRMNGIPCVFGRASEDGSFMIFEETTELLADDLSFRLWCAPKLSKERYFEKHAAREIYRFE